MATQQDRDCLREYEAGHRHPVNRALHAVGIPIVAASFAAMLLPARPFGWSRTTCLFSFGAGWLLLFAGHAIEGNRPLILKNPATAAAGVGWWLRACVLSRVTRPHPSTSLPAVQMTSLSSKPEEFP